MKKYYKIAVFILATTITLFTLSSGITKDSSRSGGGNLVDDLYEQAVKQNNNLESIEDGIEKFYKSRNEALEKYNSFTSYNSRYYSDAKSKAAMITEAVTKQKANDIISKSEAAYQLKMSDWQTIITTLNTNERELAALHTLLKVMITEPIIAKYQATNSPDNAKAKEASSDLLKVIEKIKALTK